MVARHILRLCLAAALCAVPAGAAEGPSLPPEDCLRVLRQARIAGMTGDVSRELETLRAAAEAHPQEIAPVYALIEYHRRHGQPEDELRKLRDLLARRLEDTQGELPTAVLGLIVRDPQAEVATLRLVTDRVARRIESRQTRDPDLLRLHAAAQERLGMVEAAAATLEELYRLEPSDLLEWRLYQHFLTLERWDDAIEILASLVDVEREELFRAPYIRLLGRAGRVEEQQRQIELLLSDPVDPTGSDRIELLWSSAWDLRDSGHQAEAEHQFRRLLDLDPEHEGARAVLLHLYGTEEERRTFAAAKAERWEDETDPRTLFEEGTKRLIAGDAEAAVDLLRRAAPGLPDLEAAWYNLGMAAYRLEDWATTESAFGRAAELNPERAEAYFFRGLALSTLDRCGDAVTPLERALELDPDRHLAHYHLARCYRKLGNADAAARHQSLFDASRGPG